MVNEANLDYVEVPWFEFKDRKFPDNAIGCYVNYLEISDLIILPIFEKDHLMDQEVFDLFNSLFSDRTIEVVNINEIGLEGGLLNCISWTIKK